MAWPKTPWAISNPLDVSPRDSARRYSAEFMRGQPTDSGKYPFATWGMATAAIATIIALAAGIWLALGVGPALVAVGLVLLFAAWSAS